MKNTKFADSINMRRRLICLTGGWFSSDNVGDHAILTGIIDSFSKHGNFEYVVLTADPNKVKSRYNIKAYSPKKNPLKVIQSIIESDILVFTGGTPFYDDIVHMTYFWFLVEIASLFKTPVVIYGISLRSIKKKYTSVLFRRILKKCLLSGAREEKSKESFSKIAGNLDSITYIPDLGLQVVPLQIGDIEKIFKAEGIELNNPAIGICLRDFRSNRDFQLHHYSREFSDEIINRYQDSISSLVKHILATYNFQVIFFPMHTIEPDDDRQIASDIINKKLKGYINRIHVIDKQYHPKAMKGMLGLMTAVIGVRFHSVVLATSMDVPTISICYALKNQAYMEKISQSEYTIDIFDLSTQNITALFDRLMENHSLIKKDLMHNNKLQNDIYLDSIKKVLLMIEGKNK